MKKLFLVGMLVIAVAACAPDAQTNEPQAPTPEAPTPEAQPPMPPPGMVLIPAGSFLMGDADGEDMEKPVHEVELDAFYMDTHEVTLEEFGQFVEATGYVTDAEKNNGSIIWNGEDFEKTDGVNWRFDAAGNEHTPDENNQPVTHLSWNDANVYAQWVDKRLPTEAEWEYAARGGEKGYKFAWGNEPLGEAVVANVSDEGVRASRDLASYRGVRRWLRLRCSGGLLSAQRIRPVRYVRQCLGMVRRLLRPGVLQPQPDDEPQE